MNFPLSPELCILIHNALHKGEDGVTIDGTFHQFGKSKPGYRYLDVDGVRFQKQNPSKPSKFGRMAQQGSLITWGIRIGKWIRIQDGVVYDFEYSTSADKIQ